MSDKFKKSDKFWYENPSVLWNKNRFTEFFPTPNLTLYEKLNALVRLSFYIALALLVFYGNYLYIYIPIFFLLFTYLIYKSNIKKADTTQPELLTNAQENADEEKILSIIDDDLKKNNSTCTDPTTNNPFMNINLITDKRDKPKACEYYDNKEVKKEVNDRFNFNLYRDVSDLYNKNNSQREYYTMPSTTIPNEQTSFAKWCYKSPPTCKEDTIRCVPETSLPEPIPQLTMNDLNSIQ